MGPSLYRHWAPGSPDEAWAARGPSGGGLRQVHPAWGPGGRCRACSWRGCRWPGWGRHFLSPLVPLTRGFFHPWPGLSGPSPGDGSYFSIPGRASQGVVGRQPPRLGLWDSPWQPHAPQPWFPFSKSQQKRPHFLRAAPLVGLCLPAHPRQPPWGLLSPRHPRSVLSTLVFLIHMAATY